LSELLQIVDTRAATVDDAVAIAEIYSQGIADGIAVSLTLVLRIVRWSLLSAVN
jgi:hypothetical protein